jgi:hypothetical protein
MVSLNRAKRPGGDVVTGLACHLDAFAAALSPRERGLLVSAVERAMVPLDRMRERAPGDVLSEDELRLFDELRARGDAGGKAAVR